MPVPWRGWGLTPVRVCNKCHAQYTSNSDETKEKTPKTTPSDGSDKVSSRYMGEALASAVTSAIVYSKGAITDATRPSYWVPDYQITKCYKCKSEFKSNSVKHHCRACGQGFCDDCSSRKACVPLRGWDSPVRVCDSCYKKLSSQSKKSS